MAAKKAFLSHETRIGILAIVSIVILIWGYNYLKGRNMLTTSNLMYVEYPEVEMLAISAPVLINGFRVGVIADMYLKEEDMQTIIVVLDINRGVRVPKNAIAEIISTDITGGKAIRLAFTRPCSDDDCAKNGDYLKGKTVGFLGSMVSQDELASYLGQITGSVGEMWDSIGNRLEDPEAKGISESVRNFNALTGSLNALVLASSRSIEKTMAHLSSIMGKIDEDNEKISEFLNNLAGFSDQLNKLELEKTMSNLNGTMNNADSSLVQLTSALETANVALENISDLVLKIKEGEGTIGQLFTNDSLYHNLNNASEQLDVLLEDFEERPYRYMPLKSRKRVNRNDKKDAKEKGN